jgi:hypothetical protein
MTTMTGAPRFPSYPPFIRARAAAFGQSGSTNDDDDGTKKQLRFRKRRYTKSFTRTLTKRIHDIFSFFFLLNIRLKNVRRARKSLAPATIFFRAAQKRALLFGLKQKNIYHSDLSLDETTR